MNTQSLKIEMENEFGQYIIDLSYDIMGEDTDGLGGHFTDIEMNNKTYTLCQVEFNEFMEFMESDFPNMTLSEIEELSGDVFELLENKSHKIYCDRRREYIKG